MTIDLTGRRALVTGATSGIGLAIATALAGAGARVMINGLGDEAQIAAARAAAGNAAYHGANMADAGAIAAMMQAAQAELGGVDILVNNAGIQHVAPVEAFPADKWDAILAINLSSAFHTVHAAAAGMKAQGWGRIINTASAHALVASPFKSAYVAAKHGLLGFTKAIALELAPHGVTANCISPGYVWTPLVERQIPDTMAARNLTREQVIDDVLLKAQPTKAFVTVEQVAAAALFLCSDAAGQITGSSLTMDGGWTAQ